MVLTPLIIKQYRPQELNTNKNLLERRQLENYKANSPGVSEKSGLVFPGNNSK